MRHQTREYGEANHSAISLSMLRPGRMEKYRRTCSRRLFVRLTAGVGRWPIPSTRSSSGSVDLLGSEPREKQLLTSGHRAADRPLPGEFRGLHTRAPGLHPGKSLHWDVDGAADDLAWREGSAILDREVRTLAACTGGRCESRTPRRRPAKPFTEAIRAPILDVCGRQRSRRRRRCGGPRRPARSTIGEALLDCQVHP
jgi:hypothetical protein